MRRAGFALILAPLAALPGCARDIADAVCPDVDPGELVVTELRGTQSPSDSLGPWVELYNASGRALDLHGTRLRFRRPTGAEVAIIVRRATPIAAGGYAVLGMFDDAALPPHADYGFAADYTQTWLASATLDVEACGVQIDRMSYASLPRMGSYSLGGEPDAGRNDTPAAWCTDATMSNGAFPGSPRTANIVCP